MQQSEPSDAHDDEKNNDADILKVIKYWVNEKGADIVIKWMPAHLDKEENFKKKGLVDYNIDSFNVKENGEEEKRENIEEEKGEGVEDETEENKHKNKENDNNDLSSKNIIKQIIKDIEIKYPVYIENSSLNDIMKIKI